MIIHIFLKFKLLKLQCFYLFIFILFYIIINYKILKIKKRVNSYIHSNGKAGYLLNLDPAVSQVPFGANIDIRDTVNYKQVMKEYVLKGIDSNIILNR